MLGIENLYYALGQLAYVMAQADGEIQREELQKLHEIVAQGSASHKVELNYSEIIFALLKEENVNPELVYQWAMKDIQRYQHYLTEDIKVDFAAILEKIARSFGQFEDAEHQFLARFKQDLDNI